MSGGFFVIGFLLLAAQVLAGCATPLVPVSVPVPVDYSVAEPQRSELIEAFTRMLARQRDCPASIDANLTLTFKTWFGTGAVSGYLQAMSPSYIKFVAVSPLGQPLLLLATDGDQFHYIDVGQAKIFEGPVKTEAFSRYAPSGFTPEYGYYWLIGRLWPGQVTITSVTMDPQGHGYWFDLAAGPTKSRSRIQFDPDRLLVMRHELLDPDGQRLSSIVYDGHDEGLCSLPGRISVETSGSNNTLTLVMAWNATNQPYGEQDFVLDLPGGFQRIFVK